ncbi:MAG TPA: ABC transporter permease [Cyclobacteriaceae bacterium]|nr:ABC transporter permease [Cyclobacteriaceae bacterium]
MLSNYIKIAVRQLLKNKIFSFINIFGLSVGVACCVLLTIFIQDEFAYEKHFKDHERIYRMYTTFLKDGTAESFPRTSPPIATALGDLLPEVEVASRSVAPPDVTQHLVRYKDKQFFENNGLLVDSTFFDIFNYEFAEGSGTTALDAPATVVITDKLSKKIFGDQSAIDELLIINSGRSVDTFRVTGIVKTNDKKSHTDASFFMSLHSQGWGEFVMNEQTWAWNNFVNGYLKLRPGVKTSDVEEKIAKLLEERAGEQLKGAGIVKELHLQPIDDIRLYSNFSNSFGDMGTGSITYIYILGSIGVFILLIACINFMNLTTAKAAQRAGEVGIRKSMGAYRSHLVRQFLGESFTIVAVSLVLAVGLIYLTLPVMNTITNKQLTIGDTDLPLIAGALVVVGLLTGLIAGSYPAFFLSAFEPARVLKGKNMTGDGSSLLRKGLVVFQFVITITLISSIFIIQQQLNYISNKSLGFNDKGVIMIPLRTTEAANNFSLLKREIARIPGVVTVSGTSSLPSTPQFSDWAMYPEGSTNDKGILNRAVSVSEDYFKTLGIDLIAGRDVVFPTDTFSFSYPTNKIIVNEATLRAYNMTPEQAIGQKLYAEWESGKRSHQIIGVIKDYHHRSLHLPIVPTLYYLPPADNRYSFLVAHTEGSDFKTLSAHMKETWDKVILTTPFESQDLTSSVEKQYEDDDRVNTMLSVSTALAIIISCMGLYGLSIFVAERKLKEIGIRKVLGASVAGIVGMLSRDFIKLVAISFVIAVPIGWYLMTEWLSGFEYKIELGFMVFILAGIVSFLIAWITVGFESIKAALGNPVKALRSE